MSRRHRGCTARLAGAVLVVALWLGVLATPAAAVQIQPVRAGDIEAWLIEDHANPILSLRIAFRDSGSAFDPADKAGLARLTAALLDEGAGNLDSQAFQAKLEDLAIRLSFSADRDNFFGSLTTLTANRDTAFELLRLALMQPRFDDEPVARNRSQLEAYLRRSAEDPESRSDDVLWEKLFADSPYAHPVEGTLESLPRIDRTDLQRFLRERLARNGLVLGVVGDITGAELAPLLEKTFGGLPVQAAPVAIPEMQPKGAGIVSVVNMDVPQSAISFAQPGLKRDDPRFYTLTVLNQILGGSGLSSRLFDEIRERRGLVYGVSTAPVPLDHAALIMGSAATGNEHAAETLSLIRQEWHRFSTGGVTAAELSDSKTFLTGSFPLRFTGSARLAGMLASVQLENLGIDYLNRRNGLIEAVGLEDVNTLARSLLNAEALTFVVVGRPQGVLPSQK